MEVTSIVYKQKLTTFIKKNKYTYSLAWGYRPGPLENQGLSAETQIYTRKIRNIIFFVDAKPTKVIFGKC